MLTCGCAARITPPGRVCSPTYIYLADYRHHTSLLLPGAAGGYVEWAYGDWAWFAEDRTEWWRALPTLLWPTPGTLGRRGWALPEAVGRDAVEAALGVPAVLAIRVDRERVEALQQALQRRYATAAGDEVFNRRRGLWFVPDGRSYGWWRQCNSMVADWLRRLGCGVSWPVLVAEFRLAPVD